MPHTTVPGPQGRTTRTAPASTSLRPPLEGSGESTRTRRRSLLTPTSTVRVACKYVVLVLLSVVFLIPWVWMISTSLKSPDELAVWPPVWIPDVLRWDNYATVFEQVAFLRYIVNTSIIAVLSVVGAVMSSAIVGYGFARLVWPGRDILFGLLIATLILPAFVTFIPLYVIYAQIGWINTYLPLIVPSFLGNAFFIFLLRQFFRRLPQELFDAAKIDGASEVRTFVSIALPLIRPALAVVALLQFIASWNDYFGPLVFLNDNSKYTIALGLATMQSSYGFSNFSWIMAGTAMSVVPIVALFFVAQKTFIQGITLTGLKG
jgi:multiple sugar transport system permease protein